ncbi:hypothetical protein D3C87_1071880 [compost metagenome]
MLAFLREVRMRAFSFRTSRTRIGLGAALGLLASGCALPKVSPEHGLPALVVITGTAEIPDDYLVMAGSMPAPRGFRVSLSKFDGSVLASGTIVSSSGEFSISVPKSQLTGDSPLYEITLRNALGAAVYSAPAQVYSHGSFSRVQITAISTAVVLGLKTSHQMGRSITGWDFARIAKDPQVQLFAQRIAKDAAERSNKSPGETLLSSHPLPAEFQTGAYQVISVAERMSR